MKKKRPSYQAFFDRIEVGRTKLPYHTGHRWVGKIKATFVGLTRSRCKAIGAPVQEGERPVAFRYAHYGIEDKRYVPLYDRTSHFIDGDEVIQTPKDGELIVKG